MKEAKQFSIEEKRNFINTNIERSKNAEFNKREIAKTNCIKMYLIFIECGISFCLLSIINLIWDFDWILNINNWLTNIVVPILIFNFINPIWTIIEKKIKRIKVWARLTFYLFSLVITFFISSSLKAEFYSSIPIWVIVCCVLCSLLCIFLFILNYIINKKEVRVKSEYEIAIMDEIMEDINFANNNVNNLKDEK